MFKNIRKSTILPTCAIALSLFGGVGGSTYAWQHETQKEECVPLAFSEITQIEKKYGSYEYGFPEGFDTSKIVDEGEGDGIPLKIEGYNPIGPMTRYLTRVNDTCMKVFESSNNAHSPTETRDFNEAFSEELSARLDYEKKQYHYNLADFFKDLPNVIKEVKTELKPIEHAKNTASVINNNLANSWSEKHDDIYHTEVYFETVYSTDSKGNTSSHQEMRTREVYDHTWHDYWFNKANGENSGKLLTELSQNQKNIRLAETLHAATEVNQEGADAIRSSWERDEDQGEFHKNELLKIVNTWYTGSTFQDKIFSVYGAWEALPGHAQAVSSAAESAEAHYRYKTYSSSDAGPQEYQAMKQAQNISGGLVKNANTILGSVNTVDSRIPQLEKQINDYIKLVKDGKEDLADDKCEELMENTREIYKTTFNKGLDVEGFSWGIVMLGLFGGLFAGGAVGGLTGAGLAKLKKERYY